MKLILPLGWRESYICCVTSTELPAPAKNLQHKLKPKWAEVTLQACQGGWSHCVQPLWLNAVVMYAYHTPTVLCPSCSSCPWSCIVEDMQERWPLGCMKQLISTMLHSVQTLYTWPEFRPSYFQGFPEDIKYGSNSSLKQVGEACSVILI